MRSRRVPPSGRGDREALPSPLIDRPAPDFTLPLLHEPGRLVTTKDLLGTPYVLNVWGSWCPECRVEHPVLSSFALTRSEEARGGKERGSPGRMRGSPDH